MRKPTYYLGGFLKDVLDSYAKKKEEQLKKKVLRENLIHTLANRVEQKLAGTEEGKNLKILIEDLGVIDTWDELISYLKFTQ